MALHALSIFRPFFDREGRHFFRCSPSKTIVSNRIRDTVAVTTSVVAPLAGFCISPNVVRTEPRGLLPNNLTKRPADVGFPLRPSYPSQPGATPSRYLAIDITIPSPVKIPDGAHPTAVSAISQHHSAELDKFKASGHSTNRSPVLDDLVDSNIQLLPFSVDYLGGLGPLAHRFLFGDPHPPPAPPRPLEAQPRILYDRAYGPSAVSALLPIADAQWRSRHHTAYFGKSYHTALPSQWAMQTLGFNITVALAAHLQSNIESLLHGPVRRSARLQARAPARPLFVPRPPVPFPDISVAAL